MKIHQRIYIFRANRRMGKQHMQQKLHWNTFSKLSKLSAAAEERIIEKFQAYTGNPTETEPKPAKQQGLDSGFDLSIKCHLMHCRLCFLVSCCCRKGQVSPTASVSHPPAPYGLFWDLMILQRTQ